MGAPKPPQIQPDPMLQQLRDTAMKQQVQAMQSEAAGDTASLLARYGARLAMGSTNPGSAAGGGFAPIMGGIGGFGGFGGHVFGGR